MQLKKLEEEKMKIQKYKKKALDLYKQMEFKKEGNKHIMSYNGIELALYIGDYPFVKPKEVLRDLFSQNGKWKRKY